MSPKFKRVSLNETPEFPFWGLNVCVDFDLRDFKKMESSGVNKGGYWGYLPPPRILGVNTPPRILGVNTPP